MFADAVSQVSQLVVRAGYKTCTEISPECPLSDTTLGYYPNRGLNVFFAVGFGLCAIATIITGVWKRTWGFSIAVAAGSLLECAGYVGRVALSFNPWNTSGFETQIVAIILGPTLICIGIYLTLRHAVTNLNPSLSRVPPRFYPLFFVPADVSCLVVQAVGGGVAAAATSNGNNNISELDSGNRTIIAGICLQVIVLGSFGFLSAEYLRRVRRWLAAGSSGDVADDARRQNAVALWTNTRFRTFLYAVSGAYFLILIRCIYRIAEMAGGWGNYIMQNEPSFIVLESFMVVIACALLSGFPPGFFFPHMSHLNRKKAEPMSSAEPETGSSTEMVHGLK